MTSPTTISLLHTMIVSDEALQFTAAHVWNSLPQHVTSTSCLRDFKFVWRPTGSFTANFCLHSDFSRFVFVFAFITWYQHNITTLEEGIVEHPTFIIINSMIVTYDFLNILLQLVCWLISVDNRRSLPKNWGNFTSLNHLNQLASFLLTKKLVNWPPCLSIYMVHI